MAGFRRPTGPAGRFGTLLTLALGPGVLAVPLLLVLPDRIVLVAVMAAAVLTFAVGAALLPGRRVATVAAGVLALAGVLLVGGLGTQVLLVAAGNRVPATVAAVEGDTSRVPSRTAQYRRVYRLVDPAGRTVGEPMPVSGVELPVGARLTVVVPPIGRMEPVPPDELPDSAWPAALGLLAFVAVATGVCWLAAGPRRRPDVAHRAQRPRRSG